MDARRRVINLIESAASEDVLTEKLKELVAKKPFLLGNVFEDQQTLFHLLVTHNKPKTLDALLQIKEWCIAAALVDVNTQTILHLAAKSKHISHEIPKIILKYLPALLNLRDAELNTALHLAVKNQLTWFVMELTRHTDLDRSLRNVHQQSALDLAEDHKDLRHAVCYLDLTAIKSVGVRHRGNSHGGVTDLSATFPMLSSRRDTPSSSSSSGSVSTPSLEDGTVEVGDYTDIRVVMSRAVTQSLKNLASVYQLGNDSPQFQQASREFLCVCKASLLPTDFDFSALEKDTPQMREMISSVVDHFSLFLDNEMKQLRLALDKALKDLIYTLTINGLTFVPNSLPSTFTPHPDLQMLWQLSACQDDAKGKREFSLEKLKYQALGMFTQMSVSDVLRYLRLLYAKFDSHQKLVANYVLAQLLLFESVDRAGHETTAATQLPFFKQFNAHRTQGLGALGKEINQHLTKISDAISAFSRHPLVHNVRLLRSTILDESKYSFEQLVRTALFRKRQDRALEVHTIAQALRMMSVDFYQTVSVKEFTEKNSLHIKEFKNSSEKIRYFFIQLILQQNPLNMKIAIELLIDVMRALCPLSGENFPDLHHTTILYSVFANSQIIRLTAVLDSLSEDDKKILSEIKHMTASDNNYKFMRDIHIVDSTSLPYLINLLNDFFMADQQEMNPLKKMSAFGFVLLNLIEVKLVVNFMMVKHVTDLHDFLKRFKLPVEEGLKPASSPKTEAKAPEPSRPRSPSQSSRLKSLSQRGIFFDKSILPPPPATTAISKTVDGPSPVKNKD
jgi:hypothetical protein